MFVTGLWCEARACDWHGIKQYEDNTFSKTKLQGHLVVVLAGAAGLLLGKDDLRVIVISLWGLNESSVVVVVTVVLVLTAACDTIVLQLSCTFTTDVLSQPNKISDLVFVEIFKDIVEVIGFLELESHVLNGLPGDQVLSDFCPEFRRETMRAPHSVVAAPIDVILQLLLGCLTSSVNSDPSSSRRDINDSPVRSAAKLNRSTSTSMVHT